MPRWTHPECRMHSSGKGYAEVSQICVSVPCMLILTAEVNCDKTVESLELDTCTMLARAHQIGGYTVSSKRFTTHLCPSATLQRHRCDHPSM
jgi:hypothetical protein